MKTVNIDGVQLTAEQVNRAYEDLHRPEPFKGGDRICRKTNRDIIGIVVDRPLEDIVRKEYARIQSHCKDDHRTMCINLSKGSWWAPKITEVELVK